MVKMYLPEIFVAICKAESDCTPTAMNWNCYYGEVSRACKKEDRDKAWSVDCGLFQQNVLGKVCPKELFDPLTSILNAQKLYNSRGLQPWRASQAKWDNKLALL